MQAKRSFSYAGAQGAALQDNQLSARNARRRDAVGRPVLRTPGYCRDFDYCTLGQARRLIRVCVGDPFVCPECSKPLRPPAMSAMETGYAIGRFTVGAGVTLSLAAAMFIGTQLATPRYTALISPTVKTAASAKAPTPSPQIAMLDPSGIDTVSLRGAGTSQRPVYLSQTSDSHTGYTASTQALQATAPAPATAQIAETTAVTLPAPAGVIGTDASVWKNGTRRVTVDCIIDATGIPSNCKAIEPDAGGAFARSALAWLNSQSILPASGIAPTQGQRERHRWRITFNKLAPGGHSLPPGPISHGAFETAPDRFRTAHLPAYLLAPSQPSYAPAIAGRGAPVLSEAGRNTDMQAPRTTLNHPVDTQNASRSGTSSTCLISDDGTPSGCNVVGASHGNLSKTAVLIWHRRSDGVVVPTVDDGSDAAADERWQVTFEP